MKSVSHLTNFVSKGLRNCYMSEQSRWSYIYHLDGRPDPNQDLPARDVFYSLNVILGLASIHDFVDHAYDLCSLLHQNSRLLFELPVPTYAFGMALWASARLDVPLERNTYLRIKVLTEDQSGWMRFRAQDAGIILIGMAEQKGAGNCDFDATAKELFNFIKDHFVAPSHLFYDSPRGFRRDFSSFATHTYITAALYHYGQRFFSHEALALADKATFALMRLQGPHGEWPWFYYSPKGLVVDNYETYSVHQDGMAALFLSHAEKRGLDGARHATITGFNWIFGENQLRKSMLVSNLGMIIRSIARKGELQTKRKRLTRSIMNAMIERSDHYEEPENLTLRLECRSYHLGWVLYSFGSRCDLDIITNDPRFRMPNDQSDLTQKHRESAPEK